MATIKTLFTEDYFQVLDSFHKKIYLKMDPKNTEISNKIYTNSEDIKIILTKNIQELVAFFELKNVPLDKVCILMSLICYDLCELKSRISSTKYFSKASCKVKDIVSIMIAFYILNPNIRTLGNIGLLKGWSRAAFDIFSYYMDDRVDVYTIEPIAENIKNSLKLSPSRQSHHALLYGTTLHSSNFKRQKFRDALSTKNEYKLRDLFEKDVDAIFVDGDHTYHYCLAELEMIYYHCKRKKKRILVGIHDQQPGRPPSLATEEFVKRHCIEPFMFNGWRGESPRVGIFDFNFSQSRSHSDIDYFFKVPEAQWNKIDPVEINSNIPDDRDRFEWSRTND